MRWHLVGSQAQTSCVSKTKHTLTFTTASLHKTPRHMKAVLLLTSMSPPRPKIPGGGLISPLLLIRIRFSHRSLFFFLLLLLFLLYVTFFLSMDVGGRWRRETHTTGRFGGKIEEEMKRYMRPACKWTPSHKQGRLDEADIMTRDDLRALRAFSLGDDKQRCGKY